MNNIDKSGNGMIEFGEFLSFVKKTNDNGNSSNFFTKLNEDSNSSTDKLSF